VYFRCRMVQGSKMEITIRQGFKSEEKRVNGMSREAAAAKNSYWSSSGNCGSHSWQLAISESGNENNAFSGLGISVAGIC